MLAKVARWASFAVWIQAREKGSQNEIQSARYRRSGAFPIYIYIHVYTYMLVCIHYIQMYCCMWQLVGVIITMSGKRGTINSVSRGRNTKWIDKRNNSVFESTNVNRVNQTLFAYTSVRWLLSPAFSKPIINTAHKIICSNNSVYSRLFDRPILFLVKISLIKCTLSISDMWRFEMSRNDSKCRRSFPLPDAMMSSARMSNRKIAQSFDLINLRSGRNRVKGSFRREVSVIPKHAGSISVYLKSENRISFFFFFSKRNRL